MLKNIHMLYNGGGYEIVSSGGVRKVPDLAHATRVVGAHAQCFVIPKKRVDDMEKMVRHTWARDAYQEGYQQAIKDLRTACKLYEWGGENDG